MTIRTQEEIVAHCVEMRRTGEDFFGFQQGVLAMYLDTAHVQPLLKQGGVWSDDDVTPLTAETIINEMREYMSFALGKADNERGLSANRSDDKYQAWMWLLGDQELIDKYHATPYALYGAPRLKFICESFEFTWPDTPRLNAFAQGKEYDEESYYREKNREERHREIGSL